VVVGSADEPGHEREHRWDVLVVVIIVEAVAGVGVLIDVVFDAQVGQNVVKSARGTP
jgi:hypothetical protein